MRYWISWAEGNLGDLLINILAAVIGGAAVWFYRRSRKWITQFQSRRFWSRVFDARTSVVFGTHDRSELGPWEWSGLVGAGCVQAMLSLQEQFLSLGQTANFTMAESVSKMPVDRNLILLGGPDANELTRRVLQDLDSSLSYVYPDAASHMVYILDRVSRKIILPEGHTDLECDYGVIIWAPNPLNSNWNVLVLAGCFGYGTTGAARILADKAFLQNKVVASRQPFEALIRVPIYRETPQAATMHGEPRRLSEYLDEKRWNLDAETLDQMRGRES